MEFIKNNKKLLIIVGSILLIIIFAAMWNNAFNKIKVFKFTESVIELLPEESETIPIEVQPQKYKNQIIYSGYDEEIIEIDKEGYINALQPGETTIDATLKSLTTTLKVVVNEPDKIYFNDSEITISNEEKYTLNVLANFDLNKTLLKYEVEDPSILKINENGEVQPIKSGTTNIKATYNDLSANVKFIVTTNYYKIFYNYNTLGENKEVKCNIDKQTETCKVTLPEIKLTEEYKLYGWSFEKTGKDKLYKGKEIIEIKEDTTLYLIASKYKNNYKVTFNSNGATSVGMENNFCFTNDTYCKFTMPKITREGNANIYGWSDSPTAKSAKYKVNDDVKVYKDTTFYAITSLTHEAKFYKVGVKKLVRNDLGSWKDKTDYLSTTCEAFNKEIECEVYTPSDIITNKYNEFGLGFSETKNAKEPTINTNEKIKIKKAGISYYPVIKIDKTLDLTPIADYKFPAVTEDKEKKILKVLIVEIDPILSKGEIQGKSCKGITASECLGQNKYQAVNELIQDMEESSHGIIDVQIVKTEKLNEFGTHKNSVTLLNNSKSNKLDEDTWLDMAKNGWYSLIQDKRVKELGDYSFDYEYLMNKLNLVTRRNNNEFNEVWLVNVDPTKTYESIMVGKSAYWINGTPINKDCENFRIMNVSISRPDANFECMGHASENILTNVFKKNTSYKANELNVTPVNYASLTLWEKFTLTEYSNSSKNTGLSGPGNVHFSPNSVADYDWSNTNTKVASKWKEWLNYPNLTNNPSSELFDPKVYLNSSISGTQDACRKHHRWWFGLMPHVTGFTNDGYSNNWWDYLYLSDYITMITSSKKEYNFKVGDPVSIPITLIYKSGKKETISTIKYMHNMEFSNKDIFGINENGEIIAKKPGGSTFTYYRDGIGINFNIKVDE